MNSLSKSSIKKILFVCYFFPPNEDPQAIQIGRIAKYMEADITVICGKHNQFKRNKKNKTFRYKYFPKSNFYINYILNRICIPDKFIFWNLLTSLRLLIDNRKKYDLIITFGQPMSTHLLGLIISKVFKIRWITHFSDPWYENIYNDKKYLKDFFNKHLEKLVFLNSFKSFFTNKYIRNNFIERYGEIHRNKTFVIPHSYEKKQFYQKVINNKNKFIIRHLGSFYGKRNPRLFLEALIILYENDSEFFKNIKVEFIGNISRRIKIDDLLKRLPKKSVIFRKKVSYKKSLELMSSSSLLISIDANLNKNLFLPSKIIEYLGSLKPIYVLSSKGPSIDLVKKFGYYYDDSFMPTSIALNLKKTIKKIKIKNQIEDSKIKEIEFYEAKNIARIFEEQIY